MTVSLSFATQQMIVHYKYGKKPVVINTAAVDSITFRPMPSSKGAMVLIPAKGESFKMGEIYESPVHKVTFTKDFYMDSTEITQREYDSVMSANYDNYATPAWSKTVGLGNEYPAYFVSWFDAARFCNAKSKAAGLDTVYTFDGTKDLNGHLLLLSPGVDISKNGYRLPTEAEWEYAARAGSETDFFWGKEFIKEAESVDTAEISRYAAWRHSSEYGTVKAGEKSPNAFGLYNMTGNLNEWTNDCNNMYKDGDQVDPLDVDGFDHSSSMITRGGNWRADLEYLRVPYRHYHITYGIQDHIGFRTVLPKE